MAGSEERWNIISKRLGIAGDDLPAGYLSSQMVERLQDILDAICDRLDKIERERGG